MPSCACESASRRRLPGSETRGAPRSRSPPNPMLLIDPRHIEPRRRRRSGSSPSALLSRRHTPPARRLSDPRPVPTPLRDRKLHPLRPRCEKRVRRRAAAVRAARRDRARGSRAYATLCWKALEVSPCRRRARGWRQAGWPRSRSRSALSRHAPIRFWAQRGSRQRRIQ